MTDYGGQREHSKTTGPGKGQRAEDGGLREAAEFDEGEVVGEMDLRAVLEELLLELIEAEFREAATLNLRAHEFEQAFLTEFVVLAVE